MVEWGSKRLSIPDSRAQSHDVVAELFEEPGEQSVQLIAKATPASLQDLGRKDPQLQTDRLTQVDTEVLERDRLQVSAMEFPQESGVTRLSMLYARVGLGTHQRRPHQRVPELGPSDQS